MNRIFKLEIKRAFRNRLFAATLCVALPIVISITQGFTSIPKAKS